MKDCIQRVFLKTHTSGRLQLSIEKCFTQAIKMSQFLPKIQTILSQHNLPYVCPTPTPADGNCFFHAIVDQMKRPEFVKKRENNPSLQTHITLRKAIIQYIQHDASFQRTDMYKNIKISVMAESRYKSFLEYIDHINEDGTWADTMMIQATASFLQADIKILTDTTNSINSPWLSFSGNSNGEFFRSCITLAHINMIHFQSIHPTGSQNQCRGCGQKCHSISSHLSIAPNCKCFYSSSFTETNSVNIKPTTTDQLNTTTCASCSKKFKSLNVHLAKSEPCRKFFGFISLQDFKKHTTKQKRFLYKEKHGKEIRERHEEYNKNNIETRKLYRRNNALVLKEKAASYNKEKAEKVRQNQRMYNLKNAEHIKEKQIAYNQKHANLIKEKQTLYNRKNSNLVKEKQAVYNKDNADTIKKKQAVYNKNNADFIKEKQAVYNKNNADVIKEKQVSYNKQHSNLIKEKQRSYNLKNARKIAKRQSTYDIKHVHQIRKKQARYNKQNASIIAMKQVLRRQVYFDNVDESRRYKKFKESIQDGLSFVCICCHRTFFKTQVIPSGDLASLKKQVNDISLGLFEESISLDGLTKLRKSDVLYLCRTCHKYIFKRKESPPQSFLNGLCLETTPDSLNMNELENTLIAKNIVFLKLFCLPVSRWSAVTDKVVNVPVTDNDLEKTLRSISALPRSFSDAGIIPIKLKRKLSYKNAVSEAYVNADKLKKALHYLKKQGHPEYQTISIDTKINYDMNDLESMSGSSSESDSDQEIEESSTMMIDDHPDMHITTNLSDKVVFKNQTKSSTSGCSIAPGEGKIPINLLRDTDWDTKAFPMLFPSGRYGLNYSRQKKLTVQQYFNQRLLNWDRRFSSNTPYVFSSVYYVERYQLEHQINISCRKGQFKDNNFFSIEDGFSVFDKIPGTIRYWQQKRYEMIARIEQLGPFQLFFTLSMADKRWDENYTSIFAQKGCKITFIPKNVSKSASSYDPDEILINDIPLTEFLANENKTELFRNNVLILTRTFDHRVHAFLKHIVCGPNNPFAVKFYTYRVEFQARGAAHVHGTLWLDMEHFEKKIPGINLVMQKLQFGNALSSVEQEIASRFVDTFVTVSSHSDIKDIVKDVQTHHHSRTCTKRGNKGCRFQYPRFPSEKTLISQPLKREDFVSDELFRKQVKFHVSILDKVRDLLESLNEDDFTNLSIDNLLNKAQVSKDDYYTALKISLKGTRIILKRSLSEIFINNYNTEWLRAWNGNMDLQVCMDPFAVATYITDYYTKDESGTTKYLKEAAKQKFSSLKDKMHCLVQVFLSHRQMGLCEAFYRILPSLHLSDSNIKCKFVHTGFPENRSRFLRRVPETNREQQ